jgi:hypothetical protein
MTKRLRADMRYEEGEGGCANLEALSVSPSVAKASCSNAARHVHELDIAAKSPVSQCVRNEEREQPYPHMISVAGTLVHPGRVSPASIPPMSLMTV